MKLKSSRWDIRIESKISKNWERQKIYKFDKNAKNIFTIDTPPVTANAPWHTGGAGHYLQIDMVARTARMFGFEVLFPWCTDRNGLPIEVSVEKEFKVRMQDTPREKFNKLCYEWCNKIEAEITKVAKKLGITAEYKGDFYYQTDAPYYRRITQATFIELWKRGLIYIDKKPNNYCISCRTTIADAEIEYEDFETELVYVKWKVKETGEEIVIATTRPEFICACAAVLFNPEDERYKHLEGKHAITPIYEKVVPIIAHSSAKSEFGSGLVMICSYGDYTDIRLFRELNLKPTIAISSEGKMLDSSGNYSGLTIEQARKKIIEDLEKKNLISKKEKIMHSTPICWRSKDPIEFISLPEYYLKQLPFVNDIRKIAKKLIFHPEFHRQILFDWLDAIKTDWPISRRRYYGTEIPIWYCKKCKKPWLPKPGNYYQPWKENPPKYAKCKCGSKEFVGETRTFDTWMDSSISELFITGYMRFPELFKKLFPCTLRAQGKDIVRSWLYYTLLKAFLLFKKAAFKHVWISGHGVDVRGEKMSKSKGNIVNPLPQIEKYGADAFRYWAVSEVGLGYDYRFSEERIQGAAKFLTKLWNTARFISIFPEQKKAKLTKSDEWILAELNKLTEECLEGYKDFNFFIPATKIREFIWNIFAPHYIELAKTRAYGQGFSKKEKESATYTLHICMKTILMLLAPITPFIADHIWTSLYGKKSIHLEKFPIPIWKKNLLKMTKKLTEFNSKIWDEKKKKGLSLKDEIKIKIPKELKIFEKDLKAMHNIEYGK